MAEAEQQRIAARQARHELQLGVQVHQARDVLRRHQTALMAPLVEGLRGDVQARVDDHGPAQATHRLADLDVEQVLQRTVDHAELVRHAR